MRNHHSKNDFSLADEIRAEKACDHIEAFLSTIEGQYEWKDISLALEYILASRCIDECQKNDAAFDFVMRFIPIVAYQFFRLEQIIESGDQIYEAQERNRAAGGNGSPYQ